MRCRMEDATDPPYRKPDLVAGGWWAHDALLREHVVGVLRHRHGKAGVGHGPLREPGQRTVQVGVAHKLGAVPRREHV